MTMKDLAIDYLRHLDGASLLEVLKSALSSHVSPAIMANTTTGIKRKDYES
jgi:hypothetical protein